MNLYSFFASSTAYRVRIALNLKALNASVIPVNLFAMEQRQPEYIAKNPAASVPLLEDGGFLFGQSLAIIDYLDAKCPVPRLIPVDPQGRARVLEIANLIACDIQPLNGLRVLRYLTNELHLGNALKNDWYQHWVGEGFGALEHLLARAGLGPFCLGERVTMADCCLVPQVANALRAGCQIDPYPRVGKVYKHCLTVPAFQRAAPECQPDFQA